MTSYSREQSAEIPDDVLFAAHNVGGAVNDHPETCSDEEEGAMMHARQDNPIVARSSDSTRQTNPVVAPSSDSSSLSDDLANWLYTATELGCDVFQHQGLQRKLASLGQYVRTDNKAAFDSTLAWCSALVFFDAPGTSTLNSAATRVMVAEVARLIRWANGFHRGAEMCATLRQSFLQLCVAARAATIPARHVGADEAYKRQKFACVAEVLAAFGKAALPGH